MFEALYHLLFGFVFFLGRNLQRMNFNWDTLAPGLAAYVAALFVLHWSLGKFCRARSREWSLLSSFVVALLLPALFGLTFIVPGVILQIEKLAGGF
jgi:hypothetical protein